MRSANRHVDVVRTEDQRQLTARARTDHRRVALGPAGEPKMAGRSHVQGLVDGIMSFSGRAAAGSTPTRASRPMTTNVACWFSADADPDPFNAREN
jgi:hypothetical protein